MGPFRFKYIFGWYMDFSCKCNTAMNPIHVTLSDVCMTFLPNISQNIMVNFKGIVVFDICWICGHKCRRQRITSRCIMPHNIVKAAVKNWYIIQLLGAVWFPMAHNKTISACVNIHYRETNLTHKSLTGEKMPVISRITWDRPIVRSLNIATITWRFM